MSDYGSGFGGTGDDLLVLIHNHVGYVTINREHRRNALSRAVLRNFPELITTLVEDSEVSIIVIRGAGNEAFSSGADLKEIDEAASSGSPIVTPMTGAYRNAFESVLEAGKPTIASINGYALAGGFELAMACDLRIASDDAEFGMPEVRLGMGANFATVLLPRLLPRALALELLYTGDRLSVQRAHELGLVNRIVSKAELEKETQVFAESIARNAPLTLRRYKEMTTKGWELPIPSALRLNVGPNPYKSRDRAEGVNAFLDGREPRWEAR